MLTFTNSEEKQGNCFYLLGTSKSTKSSTHLISNNTSLISKSTSLLAGGGEDICTFYSGPSDSAILSFGEQAESCGSIAYSGSESCGSIASVSSDSAGTCASVSTSGGSCGGGCSYSC